MEVFDPRLVEAATWPDLVQRFGGMANFIPADVVGPARPVVFVRLDEDRPAERIGAGVDWAMSNSDHATAIFFVAPAVVSGRVDLAVQLMRNVINRLGSATRGVKDRYGNHRPVGVWLLDPSRGEKTQLAGL